MIVDNEFSYNHRHARSISRAAGHDWVLRRDWGLNRFARAVSSRYGEITVLYAERSMNVQRLRNDLKKVSPGAQND